MLVIPPNELERLIENMFNFIQSKLKSNIFVIWSLIILGSLVYINSLGGRLFWDAEYEILQNSYIKDWKYFLNYFTESLGAGAGRGGEYWRPFLLILYSIEWHFWNGWSAGYHIVNIAFHITNSILLFFILKRLCKNIPLSLSVSLIFLTHPIQTESVTYITGIADPFSTFWMLLSLLYFLKKKTVISIIFIIFALMTKETSIIFCGILFMAQNLKVDVNITYFERLKKLFVSTWYYFLISGIYLICRMTILNFGNFLNIYNESNTYTDSILVRFYTFAKTLPIYFNLLLAPHDLHMDREISWGLSLFDLQVLSGVIIIVLLLTITFYFFKSRPEYSFASSLIILPLFPVSGIILPANALIYEHWLYIPLVGFFLIVSLAIKNIFYLLPKSFRAIYFYFFLLFSTFFLLFLSISTISRNYMYGDPERFYNNILKYNQNSLRVWNNLGMIYGDQNNWEKSANAFKNAIELDKKNESWPPHHNLGNTYKNMKMYDLAIIEFNKAIDINKFAIQPYLALTQLYLDQKDYNNTIIILNRAIEVFPQNPQLKQYLEAIKTESVKK